MKLSIKPPSPSRLLVEKPSFVIVGMMRSGSNFLERSLNMLPSVRCHGELFNPKFTGFAADMGKTYLGYARDDVQARNEDGVELLNQVLAASDRQTCGFRIFLDHDPVVMAEAIYNPAVKKIILTRNLLESFVSLLIARETDVWLTTHKAKDGHVERVHVNVDELTTFALRQSFFYNDVQTILHRTGQPYYQIDYTEIKDVQRLNGLAEFLGVDDRFEDLKEPIQRQNPGALKEKILNYQAMLDNLRQRGMARWFI